MIDNDHVTFVYDAAEQPTSITGNGVTGAFVYDGNLKRVKQVVNGETIYSVYGQSGAILYRDNATTGETTDYVRMGGMTVARMKTTGGATTTSYLHQNHLGSPVAATDTGGNVLWREDYTPFGEERQDPAANDNDENFTGHIRDEATGLLYAQARYMDPILGRFLSNDPVAFSDDKPQMFNRYAYSLNDPVNMHDPDGEYALCVAGPAALAICGGAIIALGITAYLASEALEDNHLARTKKKRRSGRRSPSQHCIEPYCDAHHGGATETGRCPDCETKKRREDGRNPNWWEEDDRGEKEKERKRPRTGNGGQSGDGDGPSNGDDGQSGGNGSGSGSSGGQASSNAAPQTGSKFHGNASRVVDGRATRLHRKDND